MSDESKDEGRPDNLDVIRELLRKLEEVASSDGPAAVRLEQAKEPGQHDSMTKGPEPETSQATATRSVPDKSTALTKSVDTDGSRSLTSLQRTGSAGPMQLPSLPEIHPAPARLERVPPEETPQVRAAAPSRRSPVIAVMSFVLGVATAAGGFIFFEPLKRLAQQGFEGASRVAGTEKSAGSASQPSSKPLGGKPETNTTGPAAAAKTAAIAVPAGDNGQANEARSRAGSRPEMPDGKQPETSVAAAGGQAGGPASIESRAVPGAVPGTASVAPSHNEPDSGVSKSSPEATIPVAKPLPTAPAAAPAATGSAESGQPASPLKAPVEAAAAPSRPETEKAPETAQVSSADTPASDRNQTNADRSAATTGAEKQPQAEQPTEARQSAATRTNAPGAEKPDSPATKPASTSDSRLEAKSTTDVEKPKIAALASRHTPTERQRAQHGPEDANKGERPAEAVPTVTNKPSGSPGSAPGAAADAKPPQVDQAEGRQQVSSSAIHPPSPKPAVRPAPQTGTAASAFALSLPERVVVPSDGRAIFDFGLQSRPARTDQLLIVVRRLPDAVALSKGSAIGNGIWLLPAEEAHGVYMTARENSVSGFDIDVELADLGGKVLSRGTTRVDLGPSLAEARKLIARARLLIDTGELESARQMLRDSAEAGSSAAAFELAQTYDPGEVDRLGIPPAAADERLARAHYERARQLGSQEAAARLQGSGSR